MQQKPVDSEDGLSPEFFSRDDIFSLEAFKLIKPTACLANLKVSGNYVVVTTLKNTLLRFFAVAPLRVTELEITRLSDDRVHNLFLDRMGWHTIISMQSGMNFYTNRNMKKVRLLSKAKDVLIDSVAWNIHNTNENSTQEILLGTNDGAIFETVLFSDEGRFISNTPEQYWRQVATLGHSVTSLEVIRHPPGSMSVSVGEPQRCVVLATTPSRLYQYAGWINISGTNSILSHLTPGSPPSVITTPVNCDLGLPSAKDSLLSSGTTPSVGLFPVHTHGLYHNVFNSDGRLPSGVKVTEFPRSFGYSDLKVYQAPETEFPSTFAWMTGPGVFFGHLNTQLLRLPPFNTAPIRQTDADVPKTLTNQDHSDKFSGGDSADDPQQTSSQPVDVFSGRTVNLTRKTKLISYPLIPRLEHPGTPLGICLTAFHVVILYSDRVKAVNVLDDQTVYSMPLDPAIGNGSAVVICRDPVTGHIWICGQQGIARLNLNGELTRIWRIYLDQLQFDEARRFCQNESQLDVVNMREAEYCFDKGEFMKSAKLYAHTSVPFEEVALRFSQLSFERRTTTSASYVLRGLAVTSDHDIMEPILHGMEEGTEVCANSKVIGNSAIVSVIDASAPLKVLISSKLERLFDQASSAVDKSESNSCSSGRVVLLVLWLAELQLTELGFLRDRINNLDNSNDRTRLEVVQQEFRQFMTHPQVLVLLPGAKELLYDLIDAHGNDEEMVFLSELLGDHSRLVHHYMRLGLHSKALRTLDSGATCLPHMYEYATTLVLSCPEDVVNTWLRLGRRLDPVKLLPAIMLLPTQEAMRYLRCAVERFDCTDQAVHHLLISLCAETFAKERKGRNDRSELTDPLMTYLEFASAQALHMAEINGHSRLPFNVPNLSDELLAVSHSLAELQTETPKVGVHEMNSLSLSTFDASSIQSLLPYDPGFALRTCKEVGHLQGTVFILKLLNMHKQALQSAIDCNDVTLARHVAQNETLNLDMRRQLWMILARHVIDKQSSIQEATNLLRECPLLKLQDILPYFPDFVTVDQFKDAICASLDSYHQRIEEVKREMHATMQSTDALRKQLNSLRSRHVELDTDTRCVHCNHLLALRPFYVFPCGHYFHSNCLLDLIQPHLTEKEQKEVIDLMKLQRLGNRATTVNVQENLDRIIAADCMYCGQVAISNLSTLFFPDQASYEAELAIWR